MSSLSLEITGAVGDFDYDFKWSGEVGIHAIFGPSGAGKTTILRVIAGLIQPDKGHLRLNDLSLFEGGKSVKPHRRNLGVVFQRGRLFPHLTVEQNLTYSPRASKSRVSLQSVVDGLGLSGLLKRTTENLSGGESQRVALGRAVLSNPDLVLLDEPVSSLDLHSRIEIMSFLRGLNERLGLPILYVSHDPAIVSQFSDGMIVVEDGRVVRSGTPREMGVLSAPGTVVPNLLRGDLSTSDGQWWVSLGETSVRIPPTDVTRSGPVWITILPTDLLLMKGRPDAISARNIIDGRVTAISHTEHHEVVWVQAGVEWRVHVVPDTVKEFGLQVGSEVQLVAKATSFDAIGVAK